MHENFNRRLSCGFSCVYLLARSLSRSFVCAYFRGTARSNTLSPLCGGCQVPEAACVVVLWTCVLTKLRSSLYVEVSFVCSARFCLHPHANSFVQSMIVCSFEPFDFRFHMKLVMFSNYFLLLNSKHKQYFNLSSVLCCILHH